MMAAIAHSHHSRRSKRRKLSRTSLGWVTLVRFPGFVCSCSKNHRSCPLLGAIPNPLVPRVGTPMGHKASPITLQEPTHRPCSLLQRKLPCKPLKSQKIRICIQEQALKCYLPRTIAALSSRFGTRAHAGPSPSPDPSSAIQNGSPLHQPPTTPIPHLPESRCRPIYIQPAAPCKSAAPPPSPPLPLTPSARLMLCPHETVELYLRLSSINIERCPS